MPVSERARVRHQVAHCDEVIAAWKEQMGCSAGARCSSAERRFGCLETRYKYGISLKDYVLCAVLRI